MEKNYSITLNGEVIPVSREVYRAYTRPVWAENKRAERAKRCRSGNGSRCTLDCASCDRTRTGGALSLDRLSEDGFEAADDSDIDDIIESRILLDTLTSALDRLSADERGLIDALFYQEKTEREVAEALGLSQKTINKRRHRILEHLRELLMV